LPIPIHSYINQTQNQTNQESDISENKFRSVTHSDFDGLVCAVLFKHMDLINDIKFVHPKNMPDGTFEITPNDITSKPPYVASAKLVLDHHLSGTIRNGHDNLNHIIDADAP
jgi:hypothetical protein